MRRLACLTAVFVLLAGSSPAAAKGITTYSASLGAGVLWNDNIFMTPESSEEDKVGETVPLLVPAASFSWMEREDLLSVSYRGEFRDYHEKGQDNLWLHDLLAQLKWRRPRPFFLEVRERREMVPRRLELEFTDLWRLLDRNTVSVRPGFSWPAGPTLDVSLALFGELLSYPGEREADQTRRLLGEAGLTKRWSPFLSTGLSLEGGKVERTLGPDYLEYLAGLDLAWELSADTDLSLALQWRMDDMETSDAQYWLKKISLSKKAPGGGRYSLSYTDTLTEWFDGRESLDRVGSADALWVSRRGDSLRIGGIFRRREITAGNPEETSWAPVLDVRWIKDREETVWGPVMDVRWVLARGILALDFGGSWERSKGKGDRGEYTEDIIRGKAALVLLLGGRFQAEAGCSYFNSRSSDDERTVENTRVYGLVTVFLKPFEKGVIPGSFYGKISTLSTEER